MAILVKFITVVARIETIERKYPGGLDAYMKENIVTEQYRDRNIAGVIFMGSGEAWAFIEKLINLGFSYIVNNECDEIAIDDQFTGLFPLCTWLGTSITSHFDGEGKESTCWLKKSTRKQSGGKNHEISK